jgi:hypothetical protein
MYLAWGYGVGIFISMGSSLKWEDVDLGILDVFVRIDVGGRIEDGFFLS